MVSVRPDDAGFSEAEGPMYSIGPGVGRDWSIAQCQELTYLWSVALFLPVVGWVSFAAGTRSLPPPPRICPISSNPAFRVQSIVAHYTPRRRTPRSVCGGCIIAA